MSTTNDKITEANERISELEKELSDLRELKECLVQAQIKNFEEIGEKGVWLSTLKIWRLRQRLSHLHPQPPLRLSNRQIVLAG